jgi:hypothetical protein
MKISKAICKTFGKMTKPIKSPSRATARLKKSVMKTILLGLSFGPAILAARFLLSRAKYNELLNLLNYFFKTN